MGKQNCCVIKDRPAKSTQNILNNDEYTWKINIFYFSFKYKFVTNSHSVWKIEAGHYLLLICTVSTKTWSSLEFRSLLEEVRSKRKVFRKYLIKWLDNFSYFGIISPCRKKSKNRLLSSDSEIGGCLSSCRTT